MCFSRDVASFMRYLDGAKSGEASMAQSLVTQSEIFGKLNEFIFRKWVDRTFEDVRAIKREDAGAVFEVGGTFELKENDIRKKQRKHS